MTVLFSSLPLRRCLAALVCLACIFGFTSALPAQAAGTISLTTLGSAYTQDFDTLAMSGTTNSILLTGWDLIESGGGGRDNEQYAADTGSSTTGDTYSYGASGNAERAFGGLRSGTLNPTIGASFTNNTGSVITELVISYTGEQWRAGFANRNAADRLDFQLSTDATSLSTGAWTDYNSLDFNSPNINTTAGALDGNGAGNNAAVSDTISALNIANGATFWIKWTDFNIANADDGLSVDDFSLTPNGASSDSAPTVSSTVPADGASGVAVSSNLTVTFSEAVNVSGNWFDLTCTSSGNHTATVSGGPITFTLDPDTDFSVGENCALTIYAANVTDQDAVDPPNNMTSDVTVNFDTNDLCAGGFTPIYNIQGSGLDAAITGAVTTKGVVVGDYEGASPALRGFYIQDATGDGDSTTSDGIFVFNGNNDNVSLGDLVHVAGNAEDYQNQTQISGSPTITNCGTGTITPTDVTLPFTNGDYPERYEGMLVRLTQALYVTEIYQLGRFGQVTLSSDARLQQPTNVVAPGAPALALQAQNNLNKIIVDDALNVQNPDPIVFGRGGNPLSASNTLRGGDTVANIVGVMTYTWGGNAASPNAYRVRPINALGGGLPTFVASNPRPNAPSGVGGTLQVVSMNLLNYFNTFGNGSCALGVGGGATDCRGADNATEFTRQTDKTIPAILAMDPDVLAVNEIENDGYDANSAIQDLVTRLNSATAPGTYAFIDADTRIGATNALGTDAIKVGILYKPASVTPLGTAALSTTAFVNGGDGAPRNRVSLAQAFQTTTNTRFVVDVNHFKSKGSACDAPDANDGQGNCAVVRANAANALVSWLATDPTDADDADVLILGDLNSYAQEDTLTNLQNGGFTNLVNSYIGAPAYSYVFDGQWGYLDYALGSHTILPQITGVEEYHINADEPVVLDYNTEFKSSGQLISLFAADQYRVSDHDPIIVGLNLTIPTAATVTRFTAKPRPAGVRVQWTTDNESDVLGFRVWRKAPGAREFVALQTDLIPAQHPGDLNGAKYKFIDRTASVGKNRYKLEIVRTQGSSTFEGPIQASVPNVCAAAPTQVSLLEPMDGAALQASDAILTWQAQACAKRYQVVVRSHTAQGPIVAERAKLVKPKLRLGKLAAGVYVWQARACNAGGCGEWSAWRSFEIRK